jgi:predicted SPOUT superfamily RNA methylase MTH1
MVRSRRKTPLVAVTTAGSDKPFKVDRSERRTARVTVRITLDGDDRALHANRYGDPWRAPMDGKKTCDPKSRDTRK